MSQIEFYLNTTTKYKQEAITHLKIVVNWNTHKNILLLSLRHMVCFISPWDPKYTESQDVRFDFLTLGWDARLCSWQDLTKTVQNSQEIILELRPGISTCTL